MSATKRAVLNQASIRELSRMLSELAADYFEPLHTAGNDAQEQEIGKKMKALLAGVKDRLAGKATLTEREWVQLCNETIASVAAAGDSGTSSPVVITAAQMKRVVTEEMIRDVFTTAAKGQTSRSRN